MVYIGDDNAQGSPSQQTSTKRKRSGVEQLISACENIEDTQTKSKLPSLSWDEKYKVVKAICDYIHDELQKEKKKRPESSSDTEMPEAQPAKCFYFMRKYWKRCFRSTGEVSYSSSSSSSISLDIFSLSSCFLLKIISKNSSIISSYLLSISSRISGSSSWSSSSAIISSGLLRSSSFD